MLTKLLSLAGIAFLIACPVSKAQVTSNILLRVFLIKSGAEGGTAFTIERNQKQYLITAKHIVAGLPKSSAKVQVSQDGNWRDLSFDVIECENPAVDIAVLRIPKSLSITYPIEPSFTGISLGQEVYFLGYCLGSA